MNTLLRFVLALALGVWLAMPSLGSEGGENAGGTGVWILPRATFMASGEVVEPAGEPRASKKLSSLNQDVTMAVSIECGSCTATLIDDLSGVPVALQVTGPNIKLPASLLQALGAAGPAKASIVVVDANQMGYVMRVVIDSTGVWLRVK
jgi:hypothetical protein